MKSPRELKPPESGDQSPLRRNVDGLHTVLSAQLSVSLAKVKFHSSRADAEPLGYSLAIKTACDGGKNLALPWSEGVTVEAGLGLGLQ